MSTGRGCMRLRNAIMTSCRTASDALSAVQQVLSCSRPVLCSLLATASSLHQAGLLSNMQPTPVMLHPGPASPCMAGKQW